MMQLGTFGSFPMMYGKENDGDCQRCTSNFSFMVLPFFSLACKVTLHEVAKKCMRAPSFCVSFSTSFTLYHPLTRLRRTYVLIERFENGISLLLLSVCLHSCSKTGQSDEDSPHLANRSGAQWGD